MAQTEHNNRSKRRRGGLLRVLLITLLCLIPIRLFLLGTYYVSTKTCPAPDFNPGSLLFVSLQATPHKHGDRVIFAYTDSLHRRHLAPALLIEYHQTAAEDSLTISSCSDTLRIPGTALHGKVIGSLTIGL